MYCFDLEPLIYTDFHKSENRILHLCRIRGLGLNRLQNVFDPADGDDDPGGTMV